MSSPYHDSSYPPPEPKPYSGEAVFNAEPYSPPGTQTPPTSTKKKGCGCLGCALGCFGVSLVGLILVGVGVWYGVQKLPDLVRQGIAQAVQDSELTPEDKQIVMQQVDRLVDGYKQGRIDLEKLAEFGEDFMESPLMDLMIAFGARVKYIEQSGLSDEEKAEAEKTLHRFARGVIEDKIAADDVDVALNHISNELPNGGRQFKDSVTDTELRAFLRECKRLADEADVPDEQVQIDIGAELKRLVDKALGEGPAEPPPAVEPVPSEAAAPGNSTKLPAERPSSASPPSATPESLPAEAPPTDAPATSPRLPSTPEAPSADESAPTSAL